ncbi:hypothetical protein [Clostridium senegalense]|uniref:Uncharacterized protein n=1 Tax=Clostridium senegalense TaxID=1465809 RepID=A0A6M0H4A5_9CLOT|nr:hypothetical protein [Clostridium senegalense]NEU05570.1 hypothetical protein [Clostridium senegalense]
MNFKKGLLILMCTLTLVGCSSSKEENKKEETKPKTESTEKKDDNEVKEETKKEDEKKNAASEDKENVSQKENVVVENKQQQTIQEETITEEKTSNEDVSKPKNETITEESAKELIKVADLRLVGQNLNSGYLMEKVEYDPSMGWCDISKHWDIPQEEFMYFILKSDTHAVRNYAIGMSSKNVYSISTQGYTSAYFMENGEIAKEYKWKE